VIFYLTLEEALRVARRALGDTELQLRDPGLLEAALARPQTVLYGQEAYPDLHLKAAALLHSLCANHPLVDGNKRLSWLATVVFLFVNGQDVAVGTDEGEQLVISIASGALDDLERIAERLRAWSTPRP
jgi:death on curing protein